MTILELTARDFCRLTAVQLEPSGDSVVLSGSNGQGKTSVIRAIDSALGGSSAAPARPIRDGAKNGAFTLTLGGPDGPELVIEKLFVDGREKLFVKNADGVRQGKPQRVIDQLLGACIDPVEFAQPPGAKTAAAADKERLRMLAEIAPLPIDLEAWKRERDEVFAERTNVSRALKEASALTDGRVPVEVPARVDVDAQIAALQSAEHVTSRRAEAEKAITNARETITEIESQIERLQDKAQEQEDRIARAEAYLAENGEALDVDALRESISSASSANEGAAQAESDNRVLVDNQERHGRLSASVRSLTDTIASLDAKKAEVLASVALPAEGLAIDEDGVLLNGRPFAAASTSEQIRASVRVAAAMAGRLRVVLVRDGNALDPASMAEILAFAREEGLQLWVERVATDVPGCVEIVEGAVREAVSA